ncbi:hypothetical protein CMU02_11890 [Elizabethkingia anophelis]|uniref:hypothetical protein n=1 Tax=Elizabethkingia anophelis TaxID=1117645 RepID=UPI00293C26CF|nr:hypothetical protein [Elizabethkingia anophelis]MDV3905502.1 hypothetical protein [Elizabethkingia anophelis]
MEIPFYYTFKEFEENYNNDLKKWFDSFPDAGETDYLNELRNEYQLFFYQNNSDFIINSNWIPDEYPEHYELSIIAYQEFMQEKLIQYLYNNGFSNFDGDYLDIPADTDVMDFWNDCNVRTRKNSAIIDDEKHKYLKEFFTFDNYTEKLNIDVKKFTNFKFATHRILEFLNNKFIQPNPLKTKELELLSEKYETISNRFSQDNKTQNTDEKTQTIYDFFDSVKDGDFGKTDVFIKLKELSHDFDIDILKSILNDLDFYLFLEREEKESEFSAEDIDRAIDEKRKNGFDIPYLKTTPTENLTEEQIEKRKKLVEKGLNLDQPMLDKESLLFPFDFFNLYQLKNLIITKIGNITSDNPIKQEDIDEKTNSKFNVPQKIKILDELNIKGWLMDKHNFTTFQIEELLSDLFDRTDKTIRNSFSDFKHVNTAKQYLEELKSIKAKR